MGNDGSKHGVHVISRLLRCASSQGAVELLRFKLCNLGILGVHFAQQTFTVDLGDEGTGGFPFCMDGSPGVTALPLDVPVRFAAAIGNGLLGLAAAVVDAGLQFKGIPHCLNFIGVGGIELENSVVFLSNLPIEASGENSRFGSALTLRQLRADVLSGGNGAAEPFAHGRVEIGGLDELVTANGVDVRAHSSQGIHDELVALAVAAVAATTASIVPAIAVPGTAYSSTDGAADEGASPVAPSTFAVVSSSNRKNRLKTFHSKLLCYCARETSLIVLGTTAWMASSEVASKTDCLSSRFICCSSLRAAKIALESFRVFCSSSERL